jgi:hypothetical protein
MKDREIHMRLTTSEACSFERDGFIYVGFVDEVHVYQHESTGHVVGIRDDELRNNQLKELIRIGYSRPIKHKKGNVK